MDPRPLRDDASLGAAPSATHPRRDARDDGGDDLPLYQGAERLLPAAGHRPPVGVHPGRPEHVLCGDEKARRRFRGRRHEGPGRPLRAGFRRRTGCLEPGSDVRHAEASPRAQGDGGPDHRPAEGTARVRGRRQPVPAGGAGPPHRRLRVERPVPVHAFRRQPEGPRGLGAEGAPEAPVRQRPRGPQQRPADEGPRGDRRHRPPDGLAPRHRPAADRRRPVRRVRPAAGVDDVYAAEPVPRRDGGRPEVLAGPREPQVDLGESEGRDAGPSFGFHAVRALHGAARDQPPGTVPLRDALVQPRARSRARRRGEGDRSGGARDRRPVRNPRELHGYGEGVPGVAPQRAAPHSRGARGGLHRARHPVREPHPPDHDPLDSSVGGRGRASGACSSREPTST